MLRWFRVQSSRVATVLLVSVTALGSLASPHRDDCHDEICAAPVAHDASAHQVGAAAPVSDTHPLHCLVCHWARSFRPPTETRFLPAPADQAGTRVHLAVFTAAPAAQVAQPPLRSPPVSPALG